MYDLFVASCVLLYGVLLVVCLRLCVPLCLRCLDAVFVNYCVMTYVVLSLCVRVCVFAYDDCVFPS